MIFPGNLIKAKMQDQSVDETSAAIGIPAPALQRVLDGKAPGFRQYLAIARWLQPNGDNLMLMHQLNDKDQEIDALRAERDLYQRFYEEKTNEYHTVVNLLAYCYSAARAGQLTEDDAAARIIRFVESHEILHQWKTDWEKFHAHPDAPSTGSAGSTRSVDQKASNQ